MSIFSRFFRFAKSETHAVIDRFEDPIKMTEQGIRDLKKDLESSLQGLAQTKAALIQLEQQANEKRSVAANYEKKAMLLLQKAQSGDLAQTEADRLASEALGKKEQAMTQAVDLAKNLENQRTQNNKLESSVRELKSTIAKWENELTTLKARARVAGAQKKINQQLASVDTGSTIAMLEKMKTKVAEDEALAGAYGEIANTEKSVDDEINKALTGSQSSSADALAELKAKLNS